MSSFLRYSVPHPASFYLAALFFMREDKEVLWCDFSEVKEAVGEGCESVVRMFGELTEKMGGGSVLRSFTWPAVLVMATRS